MINKNNVISYVINLDSYIENYNKQLKYLNNIGLYPKRFSAINAINDQHYNYKNIINKLSFYFSPKSVIGCSLSHILLCKKLYYEYYKNNNYYFLIMEDDVFPLDKYSNEDLFYSDLQNEISNIEIFDNNWDIIQLHSDGIIDTNKTYSTHIFTGSTAAYLISINGLKKMNNEKVTSHIDCITQNFIKYRKYRSRKNLFYTNEKSSVNRNDTNSLSLIVKSKLLTKLIPLRGEKIWNDYLNFKTIRFPIINREYTANNIIDSVIICYFIIYFNRIIKK